MKKNLFFAVVCIAFLMSCSKDYTCTCTETGTINVEHYTITNTKKKAIKACEAISTSTQSCVLEAY